MLRSALDNNFSLKFQILLKTCLKIVRKKLDVDKNLEDYHFTEVFLEILRDICQKLAPSRALLRLKLMEEGGAWLENRELEKNNDLKELRNKTSTLNS